MGLALLLVILVIVELVISVWMLSRHKLYLRQIDDLRKCVMEADTNDNVGVVASITDSHQDALSVLDNATPEDLEKAKAFLKSLGIE